MAKPDIQKTAKSLKEQRERDEKPVRGIFKFYDVPGGEIRFVYKKYKDEPVQTYVMQDDQIYTIPLGVAKHLSKNGWRPEHKHALDENGKPKEVISKKIHRFGFHSLDFVDDEDVNMGSQQESSIALVNSI